MAHPRAEMMEQAWSSMEEVCSTLADADWSKPTDCPGWSVRDQLAHISAIETRLLGGTPAPGDPIQAPWVRNELGARNEREIEHRRSWAPERLLEEYREATSGRAKVLRDIPDAQWSEMTKGVLGEAPLEEVIAIRIIDVFFHEQDVREATGRPGHMNGDVARFVFERMAAAMPFVVGKRAGAKDGQTVVFDVAPPGEPFAIEMKGKRGEVARPIPPAPTVMLSMDCQTFLRFSGGRRTAEQAEVSGAFRIEGDRDLAARVIGNMAITP